MRAFFYPVILLATFVTEGRSQVPDDLSETGLPSCETDAGPGLPIRVGVRTDAPPFSSTEAVEPFLTERPRAEVTGYTVELCEAFLADAGLSGCYRTVEPQDRWTALATHDIDMLCGASTATIHVRDAFDTTLYTFVTATAVAVPRSEPTNAVERPVIGYRRGSTADPRVTFEQNEGGEDPRIWGILQEHFPGLTALDIDWRPIDDHFDALTELRDGNINALVADRAILGALARKDSGDWAGIRINPVALRLQPYAVVTAPRSAAREGVPDDLALRFNQFLVTKRFRTGDVFEAYQARLLEIFGRDLDLSFVRLAQIQGEIPVGEPLVPSPIQ